MASNNTKFEIEASVRHDMGKGASRRLRREDKVPGVIYGGGTAPVSLSMAHNKLAKSLSQEAFYSHILTLKIGNQSEQVILKDMQRHPYKPRILHVDFQRVRADEKIHMNVPLHFLNGEKAPGVKEAGGVVSHVINDIEVSCLPGDLPEYIEVDLAQMQLNDVLHLSDLKVPKNVEIVALSHDDDKSIVSIHLPRIEEEPEVIEEVSPEVPASEQKAEDEAAGNEDEESK